MLTHPHPTSLLTIRAHVQHVNNGNKFRAPCVKLVNHPPHLTPCWPQESMCNMLTTATSFVRPVLYSSRTCSPTHTPTSLLTIRAHVQHVNNGNKFRSPCVILLKNMLTHPHPTSLLTIRAHVQHVNNNGNKFRAPCVKLVNHPPHLTPCWPQEGMCNMLPTATSSVRPVLNSLITPHTSPPCWPQESMCNMLTTATSFVRPVLYSSRTCSPTHTPPPCWP